MPQRSSTYFHYWVDENEFLFIDFAYRVKELIPTRRKVLCFYYHIMLQKLMITVG